MTDAKPIDGTDRTRNADNRSERFEPAYLKLLRSGALVERARLANLRLEGCDLCARYCHINRKKSLRGAVCRTGEHAVVCSYGPHLGEEDCLRGWRGSGTIFFSWCNLRCVYCQNYDISWQGQGREVTEEELATIMLALQAEGCHNINFVSPSHVVAQILGAIAIATERGLRLPLVYNSGGYDSLAALQLLDGVIDIYMPDAKYGDSEPAHSYSHVREYAAFNRAALKEMHRQVGDLRFDQDGLAERGLLVRHLILPNDIAGSAEVFKFLAEELSPDTYVNVMDQYRPCFRADKSPGLDRPITASEYEEALQCAGRAGLRRLDQRAKNRHRLPWR